MTRIFSVTIEYQEACDGKVINKDFYQDSKNVVAIEAVAAIRKAMVGFDKPRKTTNDEDVVEVYTCANARAIEVNLLAEA